MFVIDTYNFFCLIFFKIYNNQCLDYLHEIFCPVVHNGVTMRSCKEKFKLRCCKLKLGMESLLYLGFSTWIKLSNELKTTTNVNCFKHDRKKYFLKKLSETEADIYSYV